MTGFVRGFNGHRGMNGEAMHMMRNGFRGFLVLGAIAGLTACGSAQADGTEDAEAFVRVINVEVSPVQTETFVEEIRLTSVAMASQDVMIEAEESGAIREFYVDRGDRVEEGAAIAKIDDRILLAQVQQARAANELAAATWERRKRLWEEDQVGSEIAYLEARFAAEQAAAALELLEERLARTVIRAPFSGVLDERHVDVGTMVGPGRTVGRLVQLDPIKVFAGVPERYAPDVTAGAWAEVVFPALGDQVRREQVRYVGATVDQQSRTFPVEVELGNASGAIKPQMVANMSLTRQRVEDAIVVPQDALVRVEDGFVVFVAVERDGQVVAEARDVVRGPTRRNLVVIEEGVAVGERLIVVGQKSVAGGDRVNVVAEHGEG